MTQTIQCRFPLQFRRAAPEEQEVVHFAQRHIHGRRFGRDWGDLLSDVNWDEAVSRKRQVMGHPG